MDDMNDHRKTLCGIFTDQGRPVRSANKMTDM